MALPEWAAGLPPWAASWAGLATGFALLAAGFPLSSLALFGLLAGTAAQSGTPWWVAGTLAGAATALGHGASYAVFARLGPPFLQAVAAWIPALAVPVGSLRLVLARRRPWLPLFLLRWVGLGYTQVFWVLGATGGGRPALLAFLLLNDLVWGLVWAYGSVDLVVAAPPIGRWLTLGALALLAMSLVAGSWQFYRSRRRPDRTS
ncbi:hypothetical protein [Caldinitratiruptor microaerophilus]|uniref:Uncharacterized protein n=1 Tax=Caldinitratiruptor microaerophilus TaxID=671077 RepID=A0AA35G7Q5_9FIRM|nr:hypothetical protein [Caldinitratiruptor microaerophilus]BDG59568.1 hypothetical protein caldi_06580 [Caldinitratiruptor microaerophilus]